MFGVLTAASLVFFAFIGFDVVATAAEETKNPSRDLPRGIFGSLAIVTVLYVLVTIVLTGMLPYNELGPLLPDGTHDNDAATLATAFSDVGVDWAANVIAIGALAGLTTVVLVLLLGQSRIIFAMSRDGLLPRGLAKVDEKRGTPARITIGVGVVVAIIAGFSDISVLEEMVNVGTLFAFVLVSIGVIVLRKTRPDLERSYKVPFMPVRADPVGARLPVADDQPDRHHLGAIPGLDGASGWSSTSPTASGTRWSAGGRATGWRSPRRRSRRPGRPSRTPAGCRAVTSSRRARAGPPGPRARNAAR